MRLKLTKDKYIQIRISEKDKETIKILAKDSDKSISEFILDSVLTNGRGVNTNVNTKDTNILKKFLKPFAENGIKIDLKDDEINRINELWGEIKDS